MQQHDQLDERRRRAIHVSVAAGLVLFTGMIPVFRAPQNPSAHFGASPSQSSADASAARKRIAEKPASPPMPFRAGEKLTYRLDWSVFANAAALQLKVVERRDFFGRPAWHFRASAHTEIPLRSLAQIDDQFDSYTDTATLESRQYETYLNELGEKQNTVWRLVSSAQPKQNHEPVVLVKPDTRDPLGALYALRAVDWPRTSEIRAPVYDGEDVYEMRAEVAFPTDVIHVLGGNMKATKVSVRLFHEGEKSRTSCLIWFSQDSARIPVLLQAALPYGSVRAELVSNPE